MKKLIVSLVLAGSVGAIAYASLHSNKQALEKKQETKEAKKECNKKCPFN